MFGLLWKWAIQSNPSSLSLLPQTFHRELMLLTFFSYCSGNCRPRGPLCVCVCQRSKEGCGKYGLSYMSCLGSAPTRPVWLLLSQTMKDKLLSSNLRSSRWFRIDPMSKGWRLWLCPLHRWALAGVAHCQGQAALKWCFLVLASGIRNVSWSKQVIFTSEE